MKEQRILFMGTAQFALPSLSKLLDLNQNIIGVYSSPPKKANRGMEISNSPVINYAQSKGLNFNCSENLKDENEVLRIKELNPDLFWFLIQ